MLDKEIGALVAMRLCSNTAPSSDEVQTESELTKKLLLEWHDLVVKDGVVYRRKMKFKSDNVSGRTSDKSCDQFMQLCEVDIATELSYAGSMGAPFDIQRTPYYSGTLLVAVLEDSQTCARCVGEMRVTAVEAFHDMEVRLQPSANCSSQYDDLGLRHETFAVGEWLLGFDTCKLRRRQTNGVSQFAVTVSAGEISHRAMAGTNSGGQDDEQSLPQVATNGNAGSDVVHGLFQSGKIEEGFCPKFVSMSGQSAV